MEDLLTIALPVYKRTEFIRQALNSALNQTVKCKILLIDNNSPHDEFKKIVDNYNNPLLSYVKTETTVPLEENFNNCFHYADTPWITILHDDDMLHIQFVELAQKMLKEYDDIGGFAVKSHVGNKEWEGIYKKIDLNYNVKLVKKPFFYFAHLTPFVGVVLNRQRALAIDGFDKKHYPIADFDFWYRYSSHNKMLLVNQIMSYYRVSPHQISNNVVNDLINKIYSYRINIIKKSNYRNFMTYLALEDSRINNINYYKRVYPDTPIVGSILNLKRLIIAKKLLKFRPLKILVDIYRRKISFVNS